MIPLINIFSKMADIIIKKYTTGQKIDETKNLQNAGITGNFWPLPATVRPHFQNFLFFD